MKFRVLGNLEAEADGVVLRLGTPFQQRLLAVLLLYWIVDPDEQRPVLTVFELADGEYAEVARAAGDERFAARVPFAVTIVPEDLVRLG